MDHLEMVEEWIENLSGYTMDEAEAVSFENISSLLDSVYACLDRCHQGRQAGPLIHYLQTMFAAMDKINRRREVAHQSMQPTVNDFLLCGIALLRGRSDWKALENRLQKLESHLDRLAFALRSLQARLQPAVVANLETAFSCAREAIQQLKSRPEGDFLRDGLALVSESCKVLDYLVDWKHQDEKSFQQSHQRFFIPPVGAELEALLEELDITESDKWPFLLEHARSQLALQLRMEWRCLRQRLLFEPARREEIWQEVEDGLNELELSLDFNLDEDEFIDRLENCLEDLSDLFLRIRQQALPLDHLLGTPAGDVLERIFAALGGTFPRILLLELDTPPVVRVSLRDYLADGCWDHLFRAGFELVRAVPQPDPNGFSRLAELEAV
ncbi:MAG: hypothetical protein U0931_25535 [Vulcanimicrobiota bacterium]